MSVVDRDHTPMVVFADMYSYCREQIQRAEALIPNSVVTPKIRRVEHALALVILTIIQVGDHPETEAIRLFRDEDVDAEPSGHYL